MASLSDDMKVKRDIKRRATVLIVDEDLGNYGLYKSILTMEYELECTNSISKAKIMCEEKHYDAILVDGVLDVEEVDRFYGEVREKYKNEEPILLVIEEPQNKESIIAYLGIGAKEYIAKPFTKDGITNTIYEQIKKRREKSIRKSILIADDDYEQLRELKGYLRDKYNVTCVNSHELAKQYMMNHMPNLVLCDTKIFEMCIDDLCRCVDGGEEERTTDEDNKCAIPILITAKTPDEDTIRKCTKYKTEGIILKPIDKEKLLKTLERIFLVKSYTSVGR